MKYSTILSHLVKEYEHALKNPVVRKPLSYALYHTWKWCDRIELEKIKEKKMEVSEMIKKIEEIKIEVYNQALDDFIKAIDKHQQENWISNLEYGITFDDLEFVKNELKK